MKRKVEKRYVILVFLVVVAIFLGFISIIIKTDRKLTLPEKIIKDTVLSVNEIMYKPIKFIKNKVEESKQKKEILKKYQKLLNKSQKLDFLEAENKELKKQIKKMTETLELNQSLSNYSKINATIINRNIGYWYNKITIDKGTNHKIKNNMPVINNKGLVGIIKKTSKLNSEVLLLTSDENNNKVSVKIEVKDNYVFGLLSNYDKNTKKFTIDGIDQNVKIEKGAKVVTSGMSDYFPSGIIVGEVVGVKKDNYDLSQIIEMKSNVDFDNISYLTVINRNGEND